MNSAPRSNVFDPMPEYPRPFSGVYPASGIAMRQFGVCEADLAIDFAAEAPPVLVTRILDQCALDTDGREPTEYFRELSVGRRLECMLALAAGEDGSAFHFPFHCAGCGQEIELELTLDDISAQQREADRADTVDVDISGKRFALRKPCGRDQEQWSATVYQDQREAVEAMIASLAISGDVPQVLDQHAIDAIDEAMNDADPLVNFLCRVRCAECGSPNEFLIDLCEVALGTLRRLQAQLIVSVHKLASHYHWSEKEIFSVPHWRRKEYLDLISAGR